jgi:hypothetical protein
LLSQQKKGELSLTLLFHQGASTESSVAESFFEVGYLGYCLEYFGVDILAAVKRTAIPHHATFLGWSRQRG